MQYIKEENFRTVVLLKMLILDEADRMLDMGFANDIETIAGETRWRKQTLLFSATLEGNAVIDFKNSEFNEPVELNADPSRRGVKNSTILLSCR